MASAMAVGNIPLSDTFNLFKLSPYSESLVEKEKKIYLEKLCTLNIDCPYVLPNEMWQKQISLLEKFLPNITVHDIYVFLIARRSRDTELQLNAHKTMSDSLQYVKWGWVSALSGIHLPNDKVLVKAAVHHSQSLRKKEVTPWVAIHPNKSIIAAHCPCTAG